VALFPDVPEAATQGDDLAETMDMATEALGLAMEEYALANRATPEPSTMAQVMAWAAEMKNGQGFSQAKEIFYPLIAAPETDNTPVRVTISLAKRDLAKIDEKARLAGLPRSKFLARAALGV